MSGPDVALKLVMSNNSEVIELSRLTAVSGGAGQAELRSMAQRWCPVTAAKYASAPKLTRRMGEQCLAEAGLSSYASRLDDYFPRGK